MPGKENVLHSECEHCNHKKGPQYQVKWPSDNSWANLDGIAKKYHRGIGRTHDDYGTAIALLDQRFNRATGRVTVSILRQDGKVYKYRRNW